MTLYDLKKTDLILSDLSGNILDISQYQGKLLLLVNTASKCGFTEQFKGLEALFQRYKKEGLQIIGFPCNQFLFQEPSNSTAMDCLLNFGVTFPVTQKIKVNGLKTHPIWRYLKSQKKGTLHLGTIGWNFTKFLIDREGNVVARFSPKMTPENLQTIVEHALLQY